MTRRTKVIAGALAVASGIVLLVLASHFGSQTDQAWPGVLAIVGLALLLGGAFLAIPRSLTVIRRPGEGFTYQPVEGNEEKVKCGYCSEPMARGSDRCPHCTGSYYYCRHDDQKMPVITKSKWVGLFRGGRADSHVCRGCGRIIAGAKW